MILTLASEEPLHRLYRYRAERTYVDAINIQEPIGRASSGMLTVTSQGNIVKYIIYMLRPIPMRLPNFMRFVRRFKAYAASNYVITFNFFPVVIQLLY
jgi:hypothetical protein